ncbi:nitrate- and nitrite sensing domain-containing protein [Nocardia sp. NPDC005978]|uniref:sensor histidine kinase n=1 Tax=Nocardia sp. NPDC005978 TaxID=3156725 RepID=UPI0033A35B79
MRSWRPGVRTRILAIALVPSLALVLLGVGAAGALVDRSTDARDWARELREGIAPTRELIEALQEERRITLWQIAGADSDVRALTTARLRLDNALRLLAPAQSRLAELGPDAMGASVDAFAALGAGLVTLRAGVDAGIIPVAEAYAFYNRMPELVQAGVRIAQESAPDPATALELAESREVLQGLEAMSRATALGAALTDGGTGLTPDLGAEYVRLIGFYRTRVDGLLADSDADQAAAARALLDTDAWRLLGTMETALAQRALPRTGAVPQAVLPLTAGAWQADAERVTLALAELWQSQNTRAQRLAGDAADVTTRNSLWAGAAMLTVALAAILVALLLANRIIGRLRRLRDQTLALADDHLAETMRRLAAGETLDPETHTPALSFGGDEIGQVADAFQHAHAAAVTAAITESRTREGVKAVFLNIAHRSQVVVHRQLEILDEAESEQEDPTLLDIFFRLDHLATRERRNAENLVILAGGRPGRQWRNPVPLMEVVRSAVGETVEYKRVRTGRLPEVFLTGVAVGDLIHLLAELIDNATSFSPPQSHVRITGAPVGRGVALEIIDQGMGITDPELAQANTRLANPARTADFGLTLLSEDARLGLFVVSQLAARHGISVRLSESDYGGVRAIVLVPDALIAGPTPGPDYSSGQLPVRRWSETRVAAPNPDGSEYPTLTTLPALTTNPPPGVPDIRPELPRRRRQEHLAPELAHDPAPAYDPSSAIAPPAPERTAEQSRDLFSAIENGTRQGRRADPGPLPPLRHLQEGDGDYFPRR